MPSTIESRIVSMVFDNKEFEKNVATSQKTLNDLNKQLEFKDADKNFKGLEDASSKVTFSTMRSSIDDIAVKLKASTVIGIEVLKNLTNAAINFAKTWASKVIDPITTGGWNRATAIDQAKFKLEGLQIAWSDISDDIDYGVKDTAYSLASAATAAAQFAASNVELGDDMKTALRSISGVAAMTSSSYDDIANIFTGIAGANRVYGDDLNSLATRGLNATAVLAKALNTTEQNVKDMVREGEIDFKTFAKAMDDAYGAHAKKGNETFEGSLDNMKAALGRIGAEFAASFRANMIPVWNALRVTFNDVKAQMGPVFEVADAIMTDLSERVTHFLEHIDELVVKGGAFASIFEGVADLAEGTYEILTTIVDTIADTFATFSTYMPDIEWARDVFIDATDADRVRDSLAAWKSGNIASAVAPFAEMAANFKEMVQSEEFITKLVTGVRTVIDIFRGVFGIFSQLKDTAKETVEAFTNGFRIGSNGADKSIFSILGVLERIKEVVSGLGLFLRSQGVGEFLLRVRSIVFLVGDAIGVLFSNIQSVAGKISESWKKVFPVKLFENFERLNIGYYFDQITEKVEGVIRSFKLNERETDILGNHFTNLFNVFKVGKKIFSVISQAVGVFVANALSLAQVLKDAFFNVFDGSKASDFAKRLNTVIYTVQTFIKNLLFSETAAENFKRFFSGLLSVISIFKDLVTAAFSVVARVFNNVMGDINRHTSGAIDGITGFLGKIGDWLVKLREWLDAHEVFEKAADILAGAIGKILNFFRTFVEWVKKAKDALADFVERMTGLTISEHFEKIKDSVTTTWEKIKEFFSNIVRDGDIDDAEKKFQPLSAVFDILKKAFSGFFDMIQKAWPTIEKIFTAIVNFVSNLFHGLSESLSAIGSNSGGIAEILGSGALGAAGIIGAFQGTFGTFEILIKKATASLTTLKNTIEVFQRSIDAGALRKIAIAIGIVALSVVMLASVDAVRLTGAMIAMNTLVEWLKDFMYTIYGIADAMGKKGVKAFRKIATGLLILSPALLITAEAVKVLSGIDAFDLLKGLVAMHTILLELQSFATTLAGLEKSIVSASASMLLIAVALTIMIIPMKAFAKLEWEEIAKGLVAVGALLFEFAMATKLIQGSGALAAAGTVSILAAAMVLMIAPMMLFAKLEWEEIAKGLAAVGALLLEFVIATKLIKGKGALVAAATVEALAIAMIMLIAPMEAFAHMDWVQIAKGLVAIGALLVEFAIACKLLQGSGAPLAAASLILLAAALTIMIAPMEAFGRMEWSEIGKGLLVIAGALAAFVIAGYLAAPVALVIVALAAALFLLGAAVALAGAGILQIGMGLTMMAGIGPEVGETIKAALAAILSLIPQFVKVVMEALNVILEGVFDLIQTLIVGIFTMFPQIVTGVVGLLGTILSAIVEFLPTLLELLPPIFEAFWQLVDDFLKSFAAHAPAIFEHLGIILDGLLNMLADITPAFFDWVKAIVAGLIDLIRTEGPALIETIFELLLKLLEESAKYAEDITNLAITTLLKILTALNERLPEITLKVVEFIIGLINSIANTLKEKAPEIKDAIANLLGSIIKMVLEIFGFDTSNMDDNEFTKIGSFLMGGFVAGIVKKIPEFWQKIKDFFKKIGEWFKTKFEEFKDFGRRILEGLRDGVKEKFEDVKEKIVGFFEKIGTAVKKLFGIESPSKMFKEFGRQIMFGFRNGADDEHTGVMDKVKGFFGKIGEGVKDLFGIDKEDGMFTGIGKKIMSAFKNAVSDSSGDTESEVTGVFSKVTESAAGAEDQFSSVGQRLIAGLNKGMASVAETSVKTFNEILNMTKNSADGYYGQFYQIGVQLVNGLSNGMKANKPIANRSAADMANELATIARQTLGIRSPSRVFAEIGKYVDEGMAKGISQYSGLIAVAGVDVADTAVDTVSQAIAMVGNMVEDVSGDPVIRPVLDLTEIENGTQRIANMFEDPTYSAMNPFFMGGGYIDNTVAPIKMGTGSGANTTSNTTNNNAAININVNAARGQNAEEIADAVQKRLKLSLDQRGYAFR